MSKWTNKIYEYFANNFKLKEFIINIVIILLIAFVCLYNFPYVIYRPGGTIPLQSRIYLDNKKIEVGDYNLAYVSVINGNAINLLLSIFNKNWDIKKTSDITYDNIDYKTTLELEKIDLKNSINIATLIAYQKAGLDAQITNERFIVNLVDKSAKTDLEVLDEIIEIDNIKVNDINQVKDYINTLDVNSKVKILIKKNGNKKEKYAKIIGINDKKLIGIGIFSTFDIKTDPNIKIKSKSSEAGSSGGLMLSLSIYDAITDGDLTKGKKIAGTGTIESDGSIGEIAGIKYKLLGAKRDNVDVFFVAKDNYKEAKKVYDKYHLKFKLIKVETIDDAIKYLNNLK